MTGVATGVRVLITGGKGFIGRHLATELCSQGAEVHCTSRAAHSGSNDGVRWWRCDLTDTAEVRRLFADIRPAYVFHLSSLADGRRDRDLLIPIFRSETVATVNVLMAASEGGTRRLLLPGSLEEPEPGEVPSSPYAAAKAASRAYASMFHLLYQTPVVMTRIFMSYGPGQPAWKLIPATATSLLRGEAPIIRSPDRQVDWIYIADVVAGLMAALEAPDLEGKSIDIGSGQLTEIGGIAERLRKLTNPSIVSRYGDAVVCQNKQVRRADVAETQRLTGWLPRVGLDEGLRRTVLAMQHEEQIRVGAHREQYGKLVLKSVLALCFTNLGNISPLGGPF
jgi:UDP-glucose 4-epimerase